MPKIREHIHKLKELIKAASHKSGKSIKKVVKKGGDKLALFKTDKEVERPAMVIGQPMNVVHVAGAGLAAAVPMPWVSNPRIQPASPMNAVNVRPMTLLERTDVNNVPQDVINVVKKSSVESVEHDPKVADDIQPSPKKTEVKEVIVGTDDGLIKNTNNYPAKLVDKKDHDGDNVNHQDPDQATNNQDANNLNVPALIYQHYIHTDVGDQPAPGTQGISCVAGMSTE
ncbi:hypothetical protein BZA05DRAFT_447926 [Tricharina praecox]|uniref:uncharacterized protein n=1 Tax=Tricharina praecox TaxID=43433 RepID=UPI00221FA94B|nr:uncharacterized protein BZA05DRAFT_447926 [Tricharina praecox]KAI5845337.1 hypothetical protein BZA05DRAFT_447926 [Tricharina praecox]